VRTPAVGVVASALVAWSGACGGSSELAGAIQGRPWSFKQGSARPLPSGDAFTVFLFPASYTTCGATPQTNSVVLEHVPATVGHYPLSHEIRVSFSGGDNITIERDGTIDVTEVAPTSLVGHLNAAVEPRAATGTWVDGAFRADLCF